MGVTVALECPQCRLREKDLLLYSGEEGLEYTPAWCPMCRRCVSAHVEGGYRVDVSRLRKCRHCSSQVTTIDVANPICPTCGATMRVEYVTLWD